MEFDYNFFQLEKISQKRFEHYLNRKPLNQNQMFWGRGCDGWKSTYAEVREEEGEGGGGKGTSKVYQIVQGGEGKPKLMNLERTCFLNGPHPKIVGFIYFTGNPLKMMNVPYFVWKHFLS